MVVQGMPLSYTKKLNNSMSFHSSFQLYKLVENDFLIHRGIGYPWQFKLQHQKATRQGF
jgi:hypothetical protein